MQRKEKLEKKYGDPFFKSMAEKTEAAQNYYELYLECQSRRRKSEIQTIVAYIIAFLFIAASGLLSAPYFGIPGVVFLCLAVQCSCDTRIEGLWSMRFVDGMFGAVRLFNLEEKVHELQKKEVEDE